MTPSRRRTFALSSAVAPLLAMWASTWLACTPANTAGGARGPTPRPVRPFVRYERPSGDPYTDRFLALWNDIHNPENGYFSPEGIPYHSVETLLCEAPDYGHETTSEAYSYWLWLEAMYGRVTKDWSYLDEAWRNTEAFMIPTAADQPTTAAYDPTKPAMFAPELDHPTKYPAAFVPVTVGADPLASELRQTYGDSNIYLMHWLMDVDNWYGFGRRGDPKARAAFINTFQRGPEESVWETIPQPSWDEMKFGGSRGYLDLFVKDSDTPQWKYTVAPDADARAVQAVYWAKRWAEESNSSDAAVQGLVTKAAKLGDYLRYALFDKYFKPLGCTSPDCPAGGGRTAAHYLVSWFTAWGGSISGPAWSWRIASSAAHQGYQNPMAAYALSSVPDMRPRSPTAWGDWARSLSRQLELYRWLQSSEGAIAGGVNNCWNGAYGTPPAGTPTFYGMAYDESPVYRDPSSNEWFGFQTWSMERVAELYYVTADKRAEAVLSKWVAWVLKSSSLTPDGFAIPGTLGWSGRPSASWDEKRQSFDPKDATFNAGLHVTVKDTNEDVASAASLAKTLSFWAARSGDTAARAFAKGLLDRMWTKYRDAKGVAAKEARKDYKRFNDPLVVPVGWKGKMPNGAAIDASSTFVSIRSKYKSDPDWPRVESYLRGGEPPSFVYHRFWAQAEIATSNAVYGWLFPSGTKGTGSSGGAGAQHAAPTASPQSPTTTASK